MSASFEQRLAEHYIGLSAKLKEAGDYVAVNHFDIATRSLRAVSGDSGLAPATFTRLAKALRYDGFEDLREEMRGKLGERVNSFSDRAEKLQDSHRGTFQEFFPAHVEACMSNLERMPQEIDQAMMSDVVDRLNAARQVRLLGALGSTGVVDYMSYMSSFFADNWSMASRMGASLASGVNDLTDQDVLVVVTKPPFASRVIRATQLAHEQGAFVVVITDTMNCPALRHASASFVVPTDSAHFYSSYVATTAFAETLIGMVVSRAGPDARNRIAQIEQSNRRLEEVWDG